MNLFEFEGDMAKIHPHKYILDENGEPQPAADVMIWGRWFETDKRLQVKETYIGVVRVSTIFLGLDYNFMSSGSPILWETMVFGRLAGEMHGYQARYSSKDLAIKRHDEICGLVRLHMRGWRMWLSKLLAFFKAGKQAAKMR